MRNYLRNSRGAVTLFILVCVIFFFVALVNVQVYLNNKENSVDKQYKNIKESYESQNADEVYSKKISNPIKMPAGFKKASDSGDTVEEGIVIEDEDGNQYVWIPVPKKTEKYNWGVEYPKGTTKEDYNVIEQALHTYTDYYRRDSSGTLTSYKDEWYGQTTDSPETDTEGCGLSKIEYTEYKQKMLSSIYTNEGFYIGRYEAGIETNRKNYSTIASDLKPLSKKGQYPLTWVYCSEAQKLASRINVNGYTSSLMFGVQWDCVMVYLEHYGWDSSIAENTVKEYIRTNSKTWGNYINAVYTLNRGKYAQYDNLNTTWKNYNEDLEGIVSSSNKSVQSSYENGILYTTGAVDQNSKCKIYDMAGNAFEWTLENTSNTSSPCTRRGGNCYSDTSYASIRGSNSTTNSFATYGFRTSLY